MNFVGIALPRAIIARRMRVEKCTRLIIPVQFPSAYIYTRRFVFAYADDNVQREEKERVADASERVGGIHVGGKSRQERFLFLLRFSRSHSLVHPPAYVTYVYTTFIRMTRVSAISFACE